MLVIKIDVDIFCGLPGINLQNIYGSDEVPPIALETVLLFGHFPFCVASLPFNIYLSLLLDVCLCTTCAEGYLSWVSEKSLIVNSLNICQLLIFLITSIGYP